LFVEVENDPLPLSNHPKNRTFKGIEGEVVFRTVNVINDDARS